MGNFILNPGDIQGYSLIFVDETNAGQNSAIHLTITTDVGIFRYRFADDTTHPDLTAIYDFLEKGLKQASSGTSDFSINEYSERYYLTVQYPPNAFGKFTGNRI